ncbi:MAG TPA: cysteine hydrolase family protein [Bacteroidales bacterium]|nr:cysteine hydrolase family protein [Bacteroidales bacterium]
MKKIILSLFALLISIATYSQSKTAVLVIDIQKFYFPGGSLPLVEPEKAAANAAIVIDRARKTNTPVIFIQHKTSAGMDIPDIIKPMPGETIFVKEEANSFLGTGLLDHLRKLQIDTVVICGMQTHMCVEAAVRAAHDYGFKVILVHDACATRNLSFNGREVSAADVQTAVLAAMKSYATIVSTEKWVEEAK